MAEPYLIFAAVAAVLLVIVIAWASSRRRDSLNWLSRAPDPAVQNAIVLDPLQRNGARTVFNKAAYV